jgi:hypothetical protein
MHNRIKQENRALRGGFGDSQQEALQGVRESSCRCKIVLSKEKN